MNLSASLSNLPPLQEAQSPMNDSAAWKDEVSARVRAHRSGRSRVPENQPALPGMETVAPSAIAARVAERYARVPSWREAMAAEAASQAAAAAAAAQPPQPKAEAPAPPSPPRRAKSATPRKTAPQLDFSPPRAEKIVEAPHPYQPDLIRYSVSYDSLPAPRSTPAQARAHAAALPVERNDGLLDPLEDAIVEPTRLLPARVIEFPRELVAPRKARPRLAEGPLLPEMSDSSATPTPSAPTEDESLRIFEAEPGSASVPPAPARAAQAIVPNWHSIQLDSEEPVSEPHAAARTSHLDDTSLHVARIEDRLMAGVVDAALTLAAFLVFVLVFAACTTHPPAGRAALVGAGIILLAMWVLYQFTFFSLSAATPGMRYAKIALCTFDDENPTRRAMRIRIAALLLSAMPLGLGFVWAVFDEDALGWHDRITQTYQRSYREH
jgi:uncharacterized RDD family membrane protein YckC